MIKIFDANDRDFSTAGNIIIEPIKCNEIKKKSLNGWYLEVEVPIKYNDYIAKDKLCVVKTKSKLNPQAFRIGEEIERSTRRIKFKAEHVMFDAKDYALLDVRPTNMNGLNALNYINQRTEDVSPFTMYSNVETTNTAYFIKKNLLEAWEIIEERWGGSFDADNWNISFLSSIGHDNGETIAYGKNLQGFDNYEDWSSVCTKIYPVGYDGIMLPEQFLEADIQYDKPYTRIINFETDLDTEEQTEANLITELRNKAQAYIEENKVPKVSYTIISNINGDLEIGDTVKVLHPFINIFTEVLEYEYNLISKKVLSLTFGNYNRDVKTKFDNIKNTINQITEAVSKQEVAINAQTNLINSLNKNGYVYIDDNEILILDALPKENAQNVWRFGLGGIGFSSNGYEGPFEVAMTMDGRINANFITTGTLSVARIEGLANFISETASHLSTIDINQNNISSRVQTIENVSIPNLQSQIDGAIQFWNGSAIPTLSNYPANEWTTEAQRNNHRADIYTVIQDVQGELKQGKSYRFDKVNNTWQWIELTDNELSAVQALANSKAKVFYTTPTVPYNLGDLWLKDGKLLTCNTAKDANGSYSVSDWGEAVGYTDDTVANLAQLAAEAAQSTADGAVAGVNSIKDTTGSAEGKYIYLDDSSDNTLISAKLKGEINQATRSGKNRLNNTATTQTINGITFTVNNDKSITVNGTSTAKTVYYLTGGSSQTLPIGEYRFSGCPSQSGTDYFIEVYRKNPDTYPRDYGTGNNLSITDNSQEILPYIVIQNGVTVNNIVFKPMIRLSSITDDTYEQYGVSPSPDYPSEIENLEGRNKFNINTARLNKALTWSTGEYFTDNGSVASDFIKIKNNKSYISKYFIQVILFDKNKTYLGKYGNSNTAVKTFTVNNTEVEYVKICFYSIANNSEDITLKQDLQLEENIVTTPYAPHNSLAVTVKNKNELNVPSLFQVIGYTDIDMEIATGVYTVSIEDTETDVTENSFLIVFFSKDDNSKQYLYVSFSSKIATVELNKNISKIRIYAGGSYNSSVGKTTTFSKLMLEKNPTASDYIEPLEQTVYFPLEEGQKLYEGSYLAEDGIHNKIREINLAIADMNNGEDYPGWNNQTQLKNDYPGLNTTFTQANIPYKSNISNVEHRFSLNTNGTGILFLAKSQWNMTQTQWQERYPDLVLKFQYELKEEEIIPYNTEQQKAWNRIMELMTYKNITHIYSDAYAEIEYVKDNGLGIYETKANANRKYTETVEKFAQQQITNESITNTVSQTITTVANNYNELKTKFDDYAPASDVIALQRSVEQVITDTYTKTEINEKLIDGSVQKVSTTAGTFDSNGLTIEKTDAKTKGNFNEKGITVMDATSGQDEELLFAGYDEELNETIVRTKNLTVERYLTIKGVARQEKYVNPVLGGQGIGTFML